MVAVSTWRYPACSARPTAAVALCPRSGHVPNPTMGMVTPSASLTDGTSRTSVIRPLSAISPPRMRLAVRPGAAMDCTPPPPPPPPRPADAPGDQ